MRCCDAELWATPRAWVAKMGHSDVLTVLAQYGGCNVGRAQILRVQGSLAFDP